MKKLWLVGLIVVLVGSFINGLLVRNDIVGILHEGVRLLTLIGIGMFVIGIIKVIKK